MPFASHNPWQKEGVSILPPNLVDLMPIVGQKGLFERLTKFKDEMLVKQVMAGFFMVIGGWGVGKSRIGHEICLEAFSDEVSWIIEGKEERLLKTGLAEGVLPIFLRYIQVTKGPLGEEIEADSWIPRVVVEGLSRLCGLRERSDGKELTRNQDRIIELARKALKPKGWDRELSELKLALQNKDPQEAAREALDILKCLGINHLWLVVDEIEDITDVERDGLPSNEREGIDQALLTVIPRVIKAEEARQDFPEVNFLLLCSLAVGDLLRQIRAIERRTGWYPLTTNTFADVEAFFKYLETHHPEIAEEICDYPKGLKEGAFFAANRNFGWFNVIMHHAHNNFRAGALETPDLLRSFAESSTKGGRDSVFDLDALGEYRIDRDSDYPAVERLVFGLLPREVGPSADVEEDMAGRLLAKEDHGRNRPIFTRVVEIKPPAKHLVMAHLVSCGFQNTSGNELMLRGEIRFNIQDVLNSLKAYSIVLPPERQEAGHLLICEEEAEFTYQVSGLSPYSEQAEQFAPYLHSLLSDPRYRVAQEGGSERWFLAPSFSFLLDFNRLNKSRQEEQGYLRDSSANSLLEEAYREVRNDKEKRVPTLLQGIINCWQGANSAVETTDIPGLSLPAKRWVASQAPLNLSEGSSAVVMYVSGFAEADLERDLTRLAQRPSEPVLLILEDEDQRVAELRKKIDRVAPRIAPFVAIHNLARITANEHLLRLGLLEKAFNASDLRTSHFHAVIGRAKEHLKSNLEEWLKHSVERRGLLIKPVFYGTRIGDDELQSFAKGYAALVSGERFHDITQTTAKVFETERERDSFKSMVTKNVDPPTRLANAPLERLIAANGGDFGAIVPRVLLAILGRCKPNLPLRLKDLEGQFLFAIRDEQGQEVAKPREVLRHLTSILQYLGMLNFDGDKLTRVTAHELQRHGESAEAWLDGQYERDAQAIRKIHESAGDDLLNVRAKDARHRLKEAKKRLQSLNLDFIEFTWEALEEETEDDIPFFEQRFRAAVEIVREVQFDERWVYDPEMIRLFRYNPDTLRHFDTHEKSPSYPLWKRLAVLSGFYAELDKQRKELITRIDAVLADVERRVPDLMLGPDAGKKGFPTQAIELPLQLRKQELDFSATNPEKTVAAGSTTVSIEAVGYKLAYGKYLDALDRLESIRAELNDPGKLVESFMLGLDRWEELCGATQELEKDLERLGTFFEDAPSRVVQQVGIPDIRSEFQDLRAIVLQGGIRQGTDDREAAGVRVNLLVAGLWEDLGKITDLPRQIRERVQGVFPTVLSSLQARYQSNNGPGLNALTRIRQVKGQALPQWPQVLSATYGQTVADFDALVKQIQQEGEKYFTGAGETTFNVFVGFCEMDLKGQAIDWSAPENQRHVAALMDRKLLQLRLA